MSQTLQVQNINKKDGGNKSYHRFCKNLKKLKSRLERRNAKKDPSCQPGYGKYKEWSW